MELYIKNNKITLRGGSKVYNANNEIEYYVKGKLFTFTAKKTIMNKDGVKLYKVRNKYWRLFFKYAYIYDATGHKVAKVKNKISFKDDYIVYGTEDEYQIDGAVFSGNYNVIRNGEVIAQIERNIFQIWGDSFKLECSEADAPFLVALVIAIDNIRDNGKKI